MAHYNDIGSVISDKSVGRKDLTFEVTTNLCPGKSESFTVTFIPGYPEHLRCLHLDDFEGKEFRNGEVFPSLNFACFDNFSNRTEPAEVI